MLSVEVDETVKVGYAIVVDGGVGVDVLSRLGCRVRCFSARENVGKGKKQARARSDLVPRPRSVLQRPIGEVRDAQRL